MPLNAFRIESSVIRIIAILVRVVAEAICGKIIQFFNWNSGLSTGRGSGVVTSRPAAAICLLAKASYKSSWLTNEPLNDLWKIKQQFEKPYSCKVAAKKPLKKMQRRMRMTTMVISKTLKPWEIKPLETLVKKIKRNKN